MISSKSIAHIPGFSGEDENVYAFENGGYLWSLKRASEFGDICRTTYFNEDALLLTGEDGIELFYDAEKIIRDGLSGAADAKYLGDGLTPIVPTLDGLKHYRRKSELLKMFDKKYLDVYTTIIESQIRNEIELWVEHDTIDIKGAFSSLGYKLLSVLSFGEPGDSNLEIDYFTTLAAAFRIIEGDFDSNRNRLLDWYRDQIQKSKSQKGGGNHTFMNTLVYDTNLTDQEILAETQHLFIGAGGVGGVGCNVVARLQEDQKIFAKIVQESEKISYPLSMKSWNDMHYFQRYIEEILRVSPFINTQIGKTKVDFFFKGYHIPKDVLVVAGFYATNMDSNLYSNPRIIDPDRSLNEEQNSGIKSCPFSKYRKNTFVPFGGGKRTTGHRCLGEPLLYLIMKVFISILVKEYKWEVLNKAEISKHLSPHFSNEVLVSFSKKNNFDK